MPTRTHTPPHPRTRAAPLGLGLLVLLGLLGPALPLSLHVLQHDIREAQVPQVQHAGHRIQRGHLATEDTGQKLRACAVLCPAWREGLLQSHFKEKGTTSQKWGSRGWPGVGPEALRTWSSSSQTEPRGSSGSPCTPPPPPAPGVLLASPLAGPSGQLPAGPSWQATLIPNLSLPAPLKHPPPTPECERGTDSPLSEARDRDPQEAFLPQVVHPGVFPLSFNGAPQL